MTRKDFAVVAKILADIHDPWAKGQAISQACDKLGNAYPRFNEIKFRKFITTIEKTS